MEYISVDDRATLAALGVLAFALTDMVHEALGHGLATLAVGGKAVLLTTCYFTSSGHYSRWIPAAGGLMNLAVGLTSLAILRLSSSSSLIRYFLVLVAAFNLFFAFGYPAYSGIARFGDWAAVISGFEPEWLWRVLLVAVSVVGYYGSMKLLAIPIAGFGRPNQRRLQQVTLIPYVAAMILACLAGALNPSGWRTMLTSGLPAAGAAFGLTQMDHFEVQNGVSEEVFRPVQRSPPCMVLAVFVLIFFVGLLGPGIRFR